MKPASALTPNEKKFMLSHPEWFKLVRRPLFIAVTFLVLAAFAVFLLPEREGTSPVWMYTAIVIFLILLLSWSANVLADKSKPEILKMGVSLLLIAVLCWLFYRYSGADWGKLREFFFNFEKLKGNWWYLRNGLGVTLFLAVISAVGSVLIGLVVASLRSYNSPTLNLFLKILSLIHI